MISKNPVVASLILIIFLPLIASERPEVAPLLIPRTKVGQKISIVCSVPGGSHPLTFTWKKDGQEMELLNIDNSRNSDGTSFLILKSVSPSDRGNYSCTAKNSFGEDTKTAELNIAGEY